MTAAAILLLVMTAPIWLPVFLVIGFGLAMLTIAAIVCVLEKLGDQ